jgi:hypothetical protein
MGETGLKGDTGETGPTGYTGPIGPTGTAPTCLKSFMRIYNDVSQTINLEQPVIYNTLDLVVGSLAFVPGTGDVLLCSIGYYQVLGKIFHEFAIQVGAFLNGVILPGSVIGEPATTSMCVVHEILKVTAADLLPNVNSPTGVAATFQIRNHSSYITPILLDGRAGSGSDLSQVNASLMVIQLCDEIEVRPN